MPSNDLLIKFLWFCFAAYRVLVLYLLYRIGNAVIAQTKLLSGQEEKEELEIDTNYIANNIDKSGGAIEP